MSSVRGHGQRHIPGDQGHAVDPECARAGPEAREACPGEGPLGTAQPGQRWGTDLGPGKVSGEPFQVRPGAGREGQLAARAQLLGGQAAGDVVVGELRRHLFPLGIPHPLGAGALAQVGPLRVPVLPWLAGHASADHGLLASTRVDPVARQKPHVKQVVGGPGTPDALPLPPLHDEAGPTVQPQRRFVGLDHVQAEPVQLQLLEAEPQGELERIPPVSSAAVLGIPDAHGNPAIAVGPLDGEDRGEADQPIILQGPDAELELGSVSVVARILLLEVLGRPGPGGIRVHPPPVSRVLAPSG